MTWWPTPRRIRSSAPPGPDHLGQGACVGGGVRASRLPTTTTVGRSTEASSVRTSWAAIDETASASVADGVAAIISRVSSTMRARDVAAERRPGQRRGDVGVLPRVARSRPSGVATGQRLRQARQRPPCHRGGRRSTAGAALVARKTSPRTRSWATSWFWITNRPRTMPPIECPTTTASSRRARSRTWARSSAHASSVTPRVPAFDSPWPRMSQAITRWSERRSRMTADHTHHWSVTPCSRTTGGPVAGDDDVEHSRRRRCRGRRARRPRAGSADRRATRRGSMAHTSTRQVHGADTDQRHRRAESADERCLLPLHECRSYGLVDEIGPAVADRFRRKRRESGLGAETLIGSMSIGAAGRGRRDAMTAPTSQRPTGPGPHRTRVGRRQRHRVRHRRPTRRRRGLTHVVLAARQPDEAAARLPETRSDPIQVDAMAWDATQTESHPRLVAVAHETLGTIDLVICAVGQLGHHAGLRDVAPEDIVSMVETTSPARPPPSPSVSDTLVSQGRGTIVVLLVGGRGSARGSRTTCTDRRRRGWTRSPRASATHWSTRASTSSSCARDSSPPR